MSKFSPQLVPGAKAIASVEPIEESSTSGSPRMPPRMSAEARAVKIAYTVYRNVYQQQMEPGTADYVPAQSLSGAAKGLSIEDKIPSNTWVDLVDKYACMSMPRDLSVDKYVCLLFWLLRGRGIAIPTPRQLFSESYVGLVMEFWKDKEKLISLDFTSQVKRLQNDIIIGTNGEGISYVHSVYRTIVDKSKSYTALFRYAVARGTISSVSSSALRVGDTKYIELIDKLARKYQILASLEYTLFPDLIEKVWGKVLPTNFRADAEADLASVIRRFAS